MEHFYQNIGEESWFTYENLYSEMVSTYSDGAHFVEVGNWKGRSASYMGVEIINSGKSIRFDCIDIFTMFEGQYEEFVENIKPLSGIINPIVGSSNEIVHQYEDDSLDFVFIDANHNYEDVLEDLRNWLPKIKIGGVLAGHDYSPDLPYEHSIGVDKAVDDFFGKDNVIQREVCFVYKKKAII
jgi:predicted O-methyltransferase YrrM